MSKAFEALGSRPLRRADDSVNDMRIEVFNCLFRSAQSRCNEKDYVQAVNEIMKYFDDDRRRDGLPMIC